VTGRAQAGFVGTWGSEGRKAGNARKALSICIPTHERPGDLRRCLARIGSLDPQLSSLIEVCVSDNGSTYDFPALMESFCYLGDLRWRRSEANVGFDRNVLEVIGMATGEYVMLLGNDDMVVEEGLHRLMDLLESHRPDAVFANYSITAFVSGKTHNVYELAGPRTGLRFEAIAELLREKVSFISSAVVRRERLRLNAPAVVGCIGKQFIHMALIFEGLKDSCGVAYSPYPLSQATDRNRDEYDIKEMFLRDLGFVVNSFAAAYGARAMRSFRMGVVEHVVMSGERLSRSDLRQFGLRGSRALFMLALSRSRFLAITYCRLRAVKRRLSRRRGFDR